MNSVHLLMSVKHKYSVINHTNSSGNNRLIFQPITEMSCINTEHEAIEAPIRELTLKYNRGKKEALKHHNYSDGVMASVSVCDVADGSPLGFCSCGHT